MENIIDKANERNEAEDLNTIFTNDELRYAKENNLTAIKDEDGNIIYLIEEFEIDC